MDNKLKVFASARVIIFQPHIFSIAIGIIWAAFVFVVTLVAIASGANTVLIKIFREIYPFYSPSIFGLIFGLIWGFINGYLLGAAIGWFYNYLTRNEVTNIADEIYEADLDQKVNIIQEGIGEEPYTIAIVANPLIYKAAFKITQRIIDELPDKDPLLDRDKLKSELKDKIIFGRGTFLKTLRSTIGERASQIYENFIYKNAIHFDNDTFEADPIIRETPELFYTVVTRILRSFVNNELLNLPEFFKRLRIVTIFDKARTAPAAENALIEEIEPDTVILAPREDVQTIREYVRNTPFQGNPTFDKEVDVICLVSASERLTRSAARLTEDDNGIDPLYFEFTFKNDPNNFEIKKHPPYAKIPGAAALSLWDERLKVPVHEFAHAMSSEENGAIVDEYDDRAQFHMDFRINKKFRGTFIVTENTLTNLENNGVPKHVRDKLAPIRDRVFTGRVDFVQELQERLTEIEFELYASLIIRFSDQSKFKITELSLNDLAAEGVSDRDADLSALISQLQSIKDEIITGRENFLDRLRELIDRGSFSENSEVIFDRYNRVVLKHAIFKSVEPVPKIYAKYRFREGQELDDIIDDVEYFSDRHRSDKDHSWTSYSAEKVAPHISCTMDIMYYQHRLDKLLFDFMYDRLMVKVTRPPRP